MEGLHLHVRRRTDNPNRALAKSRHSRCLPVTPDIVAFYTDYQHERTPVAAAAETGMVVGVGFARAGGHGVGKPGAWGEVAAGLRVSWPVLVAWLLELEAAGAWTTAHVRAGPGRRGGRRVRLVLSGQAWVLLARAGRWRRCTGI
ncbi:hypothetical protein [Streptomyces paradoxus]|uniref:hypothetical protein n=1 Tax=Streptomyces paradoxus TaxID=66375 RepID=UPI0037F67EAC